MKLCTVFTGGTISCSEQDGVLSPDSGNGGLLLRMARQAGLEAAFETTQPYIVLSENLSAAHLMRLRDCIREQLTKGFDGIIVTHGTDTLPFAAAYLDLTLGGCGVPVVLVSANYPLRDARSNGLANFMAAADVIRAGESGVFVTYQNTGEAFVTVHRGSEVLPHLPYEDALFSLFQTPFGKVEHGVFRKDPRRTAGEARTVCNGDLSGTVLLVRPYVGITYPDVPRGTKAVLLEGWHSGTLPTASEALRDFCRLAGDNNVPVYLTGCTQGFAYESKQAYAALGIRVLPPMSPVAAYMRLWMG